MVDFSKHLKKEVAAKAVDPVEIYNSLDRAHDKGPLRPSQLVVLNRWHRQLRQRRDLVLKLHTGQGKTLVGLLMLQSHLHERGEPVLYVCPNNYLVEQTATQAKQFGFKYVTVGGGGEELPGAFEDGEAILICSVQKLFNGRTKFGLLNDSVRAGAIVLDDAHACINSIEQAFRIEIESDHISYKRILERFLPALRRQGAGTCAEIEAGLSTAFLPVPYWEWADQMGTISDILVGSSGISSVDFGWPLLKDMLHNCLCLISGAKLLIVPYQPPLDHFGTYFEANRRIFMSATIAEDAFLIKGLEVDSEAVLDPLTDHSLKWSGEKMVLLPSLVDPSLDRSKMVEVFAKPYKGRGSGLVALCPSFARTVDWQGYGATVATTDSLSSELEQLRLGAFDTTLVLANRYDGIDLPDDSCRTLILDSKPFAEDIFEKYISKCRGDSAIVHLQIARKIEQGMGRAVRGEKDYCIVILIGSDLVRAVRPRDRHKYFSRQTRKQVELGLKVSALTKQEVEDGAAPLEAIRSLCMKVMQRDGSWKAFYQQSMDEIEVGEDDNPSVVKILSAELQASKLAALGQYKKAAESIQNLLDSVKFGTEDRGWYLQEMARYLHGQSKVESQDLQAVAYRTNRRLLAPIEPIKVEQLRLISEDRVDNIRSWAMRQGSHTELMLKLDDLLSSLVFGADSDAFEGAVNSLAEALGFAGQRPDDEWKEGPDNLWALTGGNYLLIECKNQVLESREEINKNETGQMNNAIAWFARNYRGAKATNLMIVPTRRVGRAAGFNAAVGIVTKKDLDRLTSNVRHFYREFAGRKLGELSAESIAKALVSHKLTVEDLETGYSKEPVQR